MLILVVAMVAMGWIIFSPVGLKQAFEANRQLRQVKTENESLQQENLALRKEIDRLKKNDPAYLEEIARKEHGLVKKNELIFEFKENEKGRTD